MDFASGLANLEQTASNAANSGDRDNNRNNRRRPFNHQYDDNPQDRRRQRRDYGRPPRFHQQHHRGGGGDPALKGLYRNRIRLPSRPYSRVEEREQRGDRPFHIALLVVSIEDLPYEHIWKAWAMATADSRRPTLVSLLCHAKHPDRVKSPFLQQRLLLQPRRIVRGNSYFEPEYLTHSPSWGSVEITRAMIDLLVHGMRIGRKPNVDEHNEPLDPRYSYSRFAIRDVEKDDKNNFLDCPEVDKFIFVSETCLPVKALDECVDELFGPLPEVKSKEEDPKEEPSSNAEPPMRKNFYDVSWVNARHCNFSPNTPKNKYERDQFQGIHHIIPKSYRWKADQWMMLSRPHAAEVLGLDAHLHPKDQLWNSFRRINASDEMYFPTTLALANVLNLPTESHYSSYYERPQQGKSNQDDAWLLKRPVTYTDWSMGMRNPASFVHGRPDFDKVARLARKQGCLFARKFAPSMEGKPESITGELKVEEWTEVIQTIREQEKNNEETKEKVE